jgi:hypothetical protein
MISFNQALPIIYDSKKRILLKKDHDNFKPISLFGLTLRGQEKVLSSSFQYVLYRKVVTTA